MIARKQQKSKAKTERQTEIYSDSDLKLQIKLHHKTNKTILLYLNQVFCLLSLPIQG